MTPTSRLSLLWQKALVNCRNVLDIKVILGQARSSGWLRADAKKRKPRLGEAGFSEPTAIASWGAGRCRLKVAAPTTRNMIVGRRRRNWALKSPSECKSAVLEKGSKENPALPGGVSGVERGRRD
jgi:hypothetical protein